MKSVKHILQNKPAGIISVKASSSVYEALEVMMENNISALVILENNSLKGIFTERDYARKIILQGRSSKDTPVKDVMTETLLTVTPQTTINECMNIITDRHIRHLPVIDRGEVIGVRFRKE